MILNLHRPVHQAVLALAVVGSLGLAAPATADTTTTPVNPASLPRGEDPAVPQVLDRTILDGGREITVDADEVQLLGPSGDDYVVAIYDGNQSTVERVSADGSRVVIRDRIAGELHLSGDGLQLFETVVRRATETAVTVRDAETGERLDRRTFRGVVTVLDADEQRTVLGGSAPDRTLRWHTGTDELKRIAGRTGYFADLRADRVAVLTDDPYDGGCSVLTPLSAPRAALWRSCRQAVIESAPNGRRVLTVPLLMDGPLAQVAVHGQHGRSLARYRTSGWFGSTGWETNRDVLLVTYGVKKSAVVRCEDDSCERASHRFDTP